MCICGYCLQSYYLLSLSKSKEYVFWHYLECDAGTYGERCNETCGNCLDNAICNHVDGNCSTGCAAGYQGILCKMGKPDTLKY